jgi:O-antigen/teichoic acid export membrane protein
MRKKIKKITYNLLKKSEKWTKTDMIYLAKGGFWLTAGQIVSSVSVFLLAIIFANLLPKETYGSYKYILSLTGILAIPTLFGMNTAIIQAVARGYEGSFIPALKTKIKWGLLGGLAGIALSTYYYFQGNNTLSLCFLIAAVFIPFMDSLSIYQAHLKGKRNFKDLSKYNIYTKLISSVLIIAVIFFSRNIFLIIATYFFSYTLLRLIFLQLILKKAPPNKKEDPETIKYGKHLSFISVLNKASLFLDKLLIFHYLGAVELAIYAIAIAPPEEIKGVLKNINTLALPKFSASKKENIKKSLKVQILKMTLILISISLAYILIAPFVYKIFFPEYLESIKYSQLFSLSIILAIPITLLTGLLEAKKKTANLYKYTFIKPIIRIALLFALIKPWGITGIIMAIIISNIFEIIYLSTIKIKS